MTAALQLAGLRVQVRTQTNSINYDATVSSLT